MRILVRTSKWAIWARRIGGFALPVAIIPVFMHRERMIDSDTFETVELIAVALAAIALGLALGAFVRLWFSGDRGWGRAVLGFLFSVIVLAAPVAGLVVASRYPSTSDISTDPADRPVLISGRDSPAPSPQEVAEVLEAFPNARSRTYQLDPSQVYVLAGALAQARGWDIRLRRAPQNELDEGQINAIVTTLLGWRAEVSLRVRGEPGGTEVAMRSASLGATHDLGENGNRIEQFLSALDGEVTIMMRDLPSAAPEPAEPGV